MANLAGKEITYDKPYLNMVADDIANGKAINIDGKKVTINKNDKDIKKYIATVKKSKDVTMILKEGKGFAYIFVDKKGERYPWTKIDKSQYSGMGGKKSDAKSTAMQELASMYAIQKGIEKNGYKDKKKFYKDHRTALRKIYPDMDEEWENTFFQQQITVQKEVGNTKFSHYSRDDGFMDFISILVKNAYKISKKDSWNPADIWLVNDLEKNKKALEKASKKPIEQMNAVLRKMFKDKAIVGISLKKMSGKTALWEKVNIKGADLEPKNNYAFILKSIKSKLSLKGNKLFDSTDTVIVIEDSNNTINFQLRQNSPGISNLKFEATIKGASAARAGKVPLDMLSSVTKGTYGFELMNEHKHYPKTTEDFVKDKKKWIGYFKKAKSISGIDFGITNDKQFTDNFIKAFNNQPEIAMSKLMQLNFLNNLAKLSKQKRNDLLTEMSFLSQKKGKIFGPFGKLY